MKIAKEHLEKLIERSKSGIATHTEMMNENLRLAKSYMDEINNAQKLINECETVLSLIASRRNENS